MVGMQYTLPSDDNIVTCLSTDNNLPLKEPTGTSGSWLDDTALQL